MRLYYSVRDNLLLEKYILKMADIEIIRLTPREKSPDKMIENLINKKVDVVVQIAPQWEWGKYAEEICVGIMSNGIKLLNGEGSMFRWFGDDYYCGSEVGFYLSPWGYSGNSKIAYELPSPDDEDYIIADKIRKIVRRWNQQTDDILIAGQIDDDRAKYYRGSTKNNIELIEKCINLWGRERLVFRDHPKEKRNIYFPIRREESGVPFKDIIHKYALFITANSTATIEALCSGIPTMNDGIGPWSGAEVVQKLSSNIKEYAYDDYLKPLASLVHLHYLLPYDYGNPLMRALDFYSDYNPEAFTFNCRKYNDNPKLWKGSYD